MANPSSNGFFASVDNPTPTRNVYPTAGGPTLGTASGGATAVTMSSDPTAGASASAPTAAAAPATGITGQPLAWWVTLIVLFIVLGLVAKKTGNEGEFSNIKLSAYNILMISIAAMIGIGAMKVIFTRFNVPGLSTFVGAI